MRVASPSVFMPRRETSLFLVLYLVSRERTGRFRYPSATPRPPLPGSVVASLHDATLLPDKDTPPETPKTVQNKQRPSVSKVHVRGLSFFFLSQHTSQARWSYFVHAFSRAPKHERMHLSCMYHVRRTPGYKSWRRRGRAAARTAVAGAALQKSKCE